MMIGVPVWICNAIAGVLYLILTLLLVKLVYGKIFKLSTEELGIGSFSVRPGCIVIAIVIPAAVTAIYLLFVRGEFTFLGSDRETILNILSAGLFYTAIGSGFVEEIIFRGVIMNLLKKRWNTTVAVLLPSFVFALGHVAGAGSGIADRLLVIIAGTAAGVMFSLIAMKSGSVWNSAVVHTVWNLFMVGGGLTIGTKAADDALVTYVLSSKSLILTGGQFGIESSLIAVIAYIVVAVTVYALAGKGIRQLKA
jgi:hypothetical protein